MSVIDDVCSLLDDGDWHTLGEIAREAGLNPISVGFVLSFLRKYEFVEINTRSKGKARMKKDTPTLRQAVYILKALLRTPRKSPEVLAETIETRSILV